MTTAPSGSARTSAPDRRGQTRNLILATAAFTISFWAWSLIAPLGVFYARGDELDLSSGQRSMLVAGFFLGIAGTTFAVGIPFLGAW